MWVYGWGNGWLRAIRCWLRVIWWDTRYGNKWCNKWVYGRGNGNGFVEYELIDNDVLYDVATINEIVNIEPITRKIRIKRTKPKKVDGKIV